jgi:hypothetical protein
MGRTTPELSPKSRGGSFVGCPKRGETRDASDASAAAPKKPPTRCELRATVLRLDELGPLPNGRDGGGDMSTNGLACCDALELDESPPMEDGSTWRGGAPPTAPRTERSASRSA